MTDPLESNPGVTPSSPTPQYGPTEREIGAGDETQKQFQLPTEEKESEATQTSRPSPMDVARDASQGSQKMTPEELSGKITDLQSNLSTITKKLQDPSFAKNLTPEHFDAMSKVVDKMNPDLRTIANQSQGEFQPPKIDKDNVVGSIINWINGSQQTLGSALNYLSEAKKPSLASFMKLQYSVQRASQRGELFASIVGASVSGIKTIMSTQLG